jgi:hypothetical protein
VRTSIQDIHKASSRGHNRGKRELSQAEISEKSAANNLLQGAKVGKLIVGHNPRQFMAGLVTALNRFIGTLANFLTGRQGEELGA